MATHSSILAWRIPRTEEPGGLQFMGLQRVGHDWSDLAHTAHTSNISSVPFSLSSPFCCSCFMYVTSFIIGSWIICFFPLFIYLFLTVVLFPFDFSIWEISIDVSSVSLIFSLALSGLMMSPPKTSFLYFLIFFIFSISFDSFHDYPSLCLYYPYILVHCSLFPWKL